MSKSIDWNNSDEIGWAVKQMVYYPVAFIENHKSEEHFICLYRSTLFDFVNRYVDRTIMGTETQTWLSIVHIVNNDKLVNDSCSDLDRSVKVSKVMWVLTHHIDNDLLMNLLHIGH